MRKPRANAYVPIWGDELRRIREQLFLSQPVFAAQIGVSESGLRRMERQFVARVYATTFTALAQAVGATTAGLAERLVVPAKQMQEMERDGSLPIAEAIPATEGNFDVNVDLASKMRAFEVPLFELSLAAGPWTDVAASGIAADPTVRDRGIFRIRLSGTSMTPTYADGQIVEFRCLQAIQEGFVVGKDYYVQRAEEATFKRVVDADHEAIVLIAINKRKYPRSMRVPRSLIVQAAVAIAKVDLL